MKEKGGVPTPSLRAIVRTSFCLAFILILLSQTAFALPMKRYAMQIGQLGSSPAERILDEIKVNSSARNNVKESGFKVSSEKITYCSENGECETQLLVENDAGDIKGLRAEIDYGFSGEAKGATLWQSLFASSSTELVSGPNGNEVKRRNNYVWAPLDNSRITFFERTNRSVMLKYNVTPCSNGTWSLTFYSPFGAFSGNGKYASVCSAKGGLSKFNTVLERGASWETGRNPDGTTSMILYAATVNRWNGGGFEPINKTISRVEPDEDLWKNDYRFKIEGGYSAYLKSEISDAWPVVVGTGADAARTRPVGIAYLDGERYRFIQLASSSTGIPNENSVTYKGVFTGVDFTYYYEENQLKEKITLGDEFRALLTGLKLTPGTELYFVSEVDYGGLAPKVMGEALGFGNETNDSIEFTDNFGKTAYSFAPATIKDSAKALMGGKEIPYPDSRGMPAVITENAGKKYYAVSVPLNWLARSTYPVEIDPLIQLGNSSCLASVYAYDASVTQLNSQIKWDITSVPASARVIDVTLCDYATGVTGTVDNDANYTRVNNQSWVSPSATVYNQMPLTDQNTTQVWSSNTASTWHCINISQPFFTDFNARNPNFTIRIEDLDVPLSSASSVASTAVNIGSDTNRRTLAICAYATASQRPYLNITLSSNVCQNITSNLTLFNGITTTGGTCFNFTNDNVSLDCQGYSIIGNLSNNVFAVAANYRRNVTVQNCLISNYTTAINFTSTNGSIIVNTTIYNTTGIAGGGGSHGSPCSPGANGFTLYGITFFDSRNNTIENSTLSNLTAGKGGTGGNGSGSDKYGCNGGVGGSVYGIHLSSGSLNTTFNNDTLTRFTGGNGGNGGNSTATGLQTSSGGNGSTAGSAFAIYLSDLGSANSSMRQMSVSLVSGGTGGTGGRTNAMQTNANGGGGGVGVGAYLLSANEIFTGLIYNVTGGAGGAAGDCGDTGSGAGGIGGDVFGVNVSATNANATVENATLANFTAGAGGGGGTCSSGGNGGTSYIFSATTSRYGAVRNSTLTNATLGTSGLASAGSGYGIYLTGASTTDYIVANSTISQTSTNDIYSHTNAQNNTALNVTFNKDKVGFGTCTSMCNLTVQWYLRINVTSAGSAVAGAIVNVTDSRSRIQMLLNVTNSGGLTNYTIINDTLMNKTGSVLTNYSWNNMTINVTASGYVFSQNSVNITTSTTYNATISAPSSCGTITTDTTLNQNVASTGTCYTIGAHGITLDCAGYTITYDTGSLNGRYGVNNTGYSNVTIKNCIITEGNVSTTSSYAISIASGALNNTIQNNILYTYGSSSYGVYSSVGFYHNIYSNTVVTNGTTASAIYLTKTNSSSVYLNNLMTNSTGDGITALSVVDNNSLYSNSINASGGGKGVSFSTTGRNNSVYQNTILTSTGSGIYEYRSIINTSIYSNTITTTGPAAYGVYLGRTATDTTFTNNTITTAAISVYLDAVLETVVRNLFVNSTITNGSAISLYATGNDVGFAGAFNNTFLNMTFNKSSVNLNTGEHNLTIQWYVRMNVTNQLGGGLGGAIVNITDANAGQDMITNVTNSNGFTNFTIINETVMYLTNGALGNYTFNNQTINVSGSGLFSTTSFNVTSSGTINVSLPLSVCGTLTQSTTLANSLSTSGSCLFFGANDIVLDCNGFGIFGDGGNGDSGISTNKTNGTTTKNCLVTDFQHDVVIYLSYNSTINNNTLRYNSSGTGTYPRTGIYFDGFRNNTITNNTIYNLTTVPSSTTSFGGDVYGIWGTSNSSNNTISWNRIENITGGYGANGSASAGGTGSNASGIYMTGNNTISDNIVANITGGHGGKGADRNSPTLAAYAGGTGGLSNGIWVNSVNNWVVRNNVSLIVGGPGGNGGANSNAGAGGAGGAGGAVYGMLIDGGGNHLLLNNVTNITGGIAGDGGVSTSGTGGAGGGGGYSYLMGIRDGTNAEDNDTLAYATGGTGGNGGIGGGGTGASGNGGSCTILSNWLSSSDAVSYVTAKNATGGAVAGVGTGGTAGYGYGIYFGTASSNYTNMSISETATYDLYTSDGVNDIFLNCSFDKTKISWDTGLGTEQNLTRKWYIRVNTTDNTGSALAADANVSGPIDGQILSATLGASGLSSIVPAGDVIIYCPAGCGVPQSERTFNNHTVNASFGLGFNSTSINVTNNLVINVTIYGTTADLSFTITLPATGCSNGKGCVTGGCAQCTRAWIEATDLTGAANQQCVVPEGQTASLAFLNFTNTGSVNLNWTMKLNASFSGTYKLNVTNGTDSCADSQQVTTSYMTVQGNIGTSTSAYAWLYGEFVNAVYGNEAEDLNHTSGQS